MFLTNPEQSPFHVTQGIQKTLKLTLTIFYIFMLQFFKRPRGLVFMLTAFVRLKTSLARVNWSCFLHIHATIVISVLVEWHWFLDLRCVLLKSVLKDLVIERRHLRYWHTLSSILTIKKNLGQTRIFFLFFLIFSNMLNVFNHWYVTFFVYINNFPIAWKHLFSIEW